jgi:hypothetical protein
MSTSIAQSIEAVCQEKGVDRDLVIEAIKEAVRAAAKKQFKGGEDIQVDWTPEAGLELSASKVVVEEVQDPTTELSIDEARELGGDEVEVGDALLLPMPMEDLGRIAAQTAKQILFQKVRDAERSNIYEQYIDRVGELVNGFVKRFERGNMIVDLGNLEAILPRSQQSRGEQWNQGERIRVVITNVSKESKGPQIEVSRTSPEMAGVKLQKSAASSVPTRLATSTIDQTRPSLPKCAGVGLAMTGSTMVMVFSVKSCWRPSTTMRNPTGNPRPTTSGCHEPAGTRSARIDSASSEKLIDSPAATPDHQSETAGRDISSSPKRRTIS